VVRQWVQWIWMLGCGSTLAGIVSQVATVCTDQELAGRCCWQLAGRCFPWGTEGASFASTCMGTAEKLESWDLVHGLRAITYCANNGAMHWRGGGQANKREAEMASNLQ
jgi:hypothetical protein